MKKHVFSCSIILFLINFFCYSQTPNIVLSKFFGGNRGEAKSIQKTSDGGYIVAGIAENAHPEATNYHGGLDGFVVKLNAVLGIEWAKCYGTNNGENISQIKQTNDGGYIFVGKAYVHYDNSTVGTTETDYWIVRIDADGNILWEKKYGGSGEERARSVEETSNGDFVVSGWSDSTDGVNSTNYGRVDYWLIKLGSNGNILLNKKYGGSDDNYGYASVVNSDGSIIMVGESFSENNQVTCTNPLICESSFWVIKVNTLGNIVWSKCVGSIYSSANYFNTAYDIIKTYDGGYVVAGTGWDGNMENTYGTSDFWVVKYDSNGNQQWRGHYGGYDHDDAYSIRQTIDGGYVVVGSTYSVDGLVTVNLGNNSSQNGWIIKLSNTGVFEWQRTAGSNGFWGYDLFNDLVQISNTEFVVAGKAGSPNNDCVDSNGRGFWITKVSYGSLSSNNNALTNFEMYPNPASKEVFFNSEEFVTRINIYDISGRKVLEKSADSITQIDVSKLSKGIYNIEIANATHLSSKKLIIN